MFFEDRQVRARRRHFSRLMRKCDACSMAVTLDMPSTDVVEDGMRIHVAASALTVFAALALAVAVVGCGGGSSAPAQDGGASGAGGSQGGSGGSGSGSGGAGAQDAADALDLAAPADALDVADVSDGNAVDAKDATADGQADGSGSEAGLSPCQELFAKCTLVDPGTGAIHDCVTTGMQGNAAACQTSFVACKQSCGAALCQHLGTICHDKDETCHEMGHDGVADPCFTRALACADLCK